MSGAIHIKNAKKGKQLVKALTRMQEQKQIDEDLKVQGAHETVEKLEKEVAGQEVRIQKLWAWKMGQTK